MRSAGLEVFYSVKCLGCVIQNTASLFPAKSMAQARLQCLSVCLRRLSPVMLVPDSTSWWQNMRTCISDFICAASGCSGVLWDELSSSWGQTHLAVWCGVCCKTGAPESSWKHYFFKNNKNNNNNNSLIPPSL